LNCIVPLASYDHELEPEARNRFPAKKIASEPGGHGLRKVKTSSIIGRSAEILERWG
jgi:hypothetical protein